MMATLPNVRTLRSPCFIARYLTDPERNVPRAIVLGVAGVSLLYLAGTLAVQGRAAAA